MWNYSDEVKKLFEEASGADGKEAQERSHAGVLIDTNASGEVGSLVCGDALKLMLKIDPETEIIEDAKFLTYGCASAIAASSLLVDQIIGLTIDEAKKNVSNAEISNRLDLPPAKRHCSVMCSEALEAAIANYRGEKLVEHEEDEGENAELVCKCYAITRGFLRRVIWENHESISTIEDLIDFTKVSSACGSCRARVEEILDETWEELEAIGVHRPGMKQAPIPGLKVAVSTTKAAPAPAAAKPVEAQHEIKDSPYLDKIASIIAQMNKGFTDGSKITLTDIAENDIKLEFSGNIASGMMHDMTLTFFKTQLAASLGDQAAKLNVIA